MPRLTILPENASVEIAAGESLVEAGKKAGVEIEAGCYQCYCGACAVEVVAGIAHLSEPSPEELDVLDGWGKDCQTYRLACSARILKGDVTIRKGAPFSTALAPCLKKPLQDDPQSG
jgi:ferredoxin